MYQYYIQLKNPKGKFSFKKCEGYQLPNNFAACQERGKWIVSDVLSGTKITEGDWTLKDAKLQLEKLMPKVIKAHKSDYYKAAVERMIQYVASVPEKQRVIGWKRYFKNK